MIKPREKFTFRSFGDEDGRTRLLICPECGETLSPADLESFAKCPFCGHAFERTGELEDFLLGPLVENWIQRNSGDSDAPVRLLRF